MADTIDTINEAAAASGIDDIDIVIGDDGSTDRTAEISGELEKKFPCVRTVTNPVNMGMGETIKKGLQEVKYEQFIIVAGDNDQSKDLIRLMLKYRDSAEMVMCFPINSENRPLFRNILSHLYRSIYMVAFRIYPNYINGTSVYRTERVKALKLRSRRFSIIAEMNTKLLRSGVTFCEIPGYFQTGVRPRGILSVKNITEVAISFTRLLLEIYIFDRSSFKHFPKRVIVDFL